MSADKVPNTPESDTSVSTSASFQTSLTPTIGANLSPLQTVAEELPAESHHNRNALKVVSLNLGGRNTNPLEFEIKGDNSDTALAAVAVLRKATKALKSAQEGPLLMPAAEIAAIEEILAQIFSESMNEAFDQEWRPRIENWLRWETWGQVLASVKATNVHLFNALNLYTLKLNRPSVWENPASCREFTNTQEYLAAWKQWYNGLDREGQFWLEDAPRAATKRGMDVQTAFAGLLLFDVMSLCTARCSIHPTAMDVDDVSDEDGRDVPFKDLARFASRLPASTFTARHEVAKRFTEGSHAVLAQEARSFAENPTIADEFMPPFCACDGFTAVFLRKDCFSEVVDISAEVARRMEELVDGKAPESLRRAWRTSARRLAAVSCVCRQQPLRGSRVCLVSLHMSKSDFTAAFVESLREVLADYDADINIAGMDSNCVGSEAAEFKKRLLRAGLEIGCHPKDEQVTTAKARTHFQTQIQKVGDNDISHKDYIVSWTSSRFRRGATTYTPDVHTSYGIERETKQCMRLPTTKWPFDHCGIATSFKRRYTCKTEFRCSCWLCCRCFVALILLFLFSSPLLSKTRSSVYGPPGDWFTVSFLYAARFGICEAAPPCAEGWLEDGGSCYVTTPEELDYPNLEEFCRKSNGVPVIIGSEEENQLVLQSLCPEGRFCYIGLHSSHDGESFWPTGEPYNFTRLANSDERSVPLFDASRHLDYLVSVINNMPDNVSGCNPLMSENFDDDLTFEFVVTQILNPTSALLVTAVVWALPRPREERLANRLLGLALFVNLGWWTPKLLNSCFVDDFGLRESLSTSGAMLEAGGHTATSLIAMWMIVKRMCMLYTRKGLRIAYWVQVIGTVLFYLIAILFVDPVSPMSWSWAVLLLFGVELIILLAYVVTSVIACRDLYRTWSFLHKEATSGCNDQATVLTQSVRAAKLHFFTVLFAIMSGALRWGVIALFLIMKATIRDGYPVWTEGFYMYATALDSITNDICAHVLAVLNMERAVTRAKGISSEVAERAEREVEQHRLAVRMLKAAPTSSEQMQQFALLESNARAAVGTEQETQAFLILQSAIRVETARIHRLMLCVRARAMTLQMRYQYLIDVPAYGGPPRQQVPAEFSAGEESESAAEKYLNWLHGEATGAQEVLFRQVRDLLATFNDKQFPKDLGLTQESFPWRIWASGSSQSALAKGEVISPGIILTHCPHKSKCFSQGAVPALCVVLEETSADQVMIHRSGREFPEQVPRCELRNCTGGGVFVPGPQKKKHRSVEKIVADYEESAWPAAASLCDICRCMVLCDDPYAMAVFVIYLTKTMKVLRVKNRFNEDMCDSRSAEELQAMFNAASSASDASSDSQVTSAAMDGYTGDHQYRDISMNVEVRSPSGVPFVCELQVTLSNLAILKKADQKLYTIRRMKSPKALQKAYTFVEAGLPAAAEAATTPVQ